ncbi:MAG: MBG domain-containing protein, partial [Pedobacter sp.]
MTASICRSFRALLGCGCVVVAVLLMTSANAMAQDVSSLVTVKKSERSVTDLKTKLVTTTASITIKNISGSVIGSPLNAVFDISSASVQVLDAVAPGVSNAYGKYYVDLSTKVNSDNLQPASSVTFSVRLVCPSSIRYTYNVVTYGTLTKATPTISWPTPAGITYGTALSANQLNATANPSGGTFAYNPSLGTVLAAGNGQTLSVTFTPTDLVNYTTATASVKINVSPANLIVTAAAKAKTYGQTDPPLTYTTGDFANGDTSAILTGSLTRVAGETVGSYVIQQGSVSAGSNYTIAYAGANLTISKAAPIIVWATPAAIDFGTALSVTQLNATASVPGNFLYTPAVGEVLSAGLHTLNVVFTPNDAANYTTATYAVSLTINGSSGVNQTPKANAGPDQTVTLSGAQTSFDVTLDGTQSVDPDGSVATYAWTGIPSPNPSNAASPKVTLYPGTYKYTLVVTDDKGAQSSPSVVTITVKQTLSPPVLTVSPGYSYSVDQGNTVSFNASASQIDGNVVSISAIPFVKNATFSSTPGVQAAGTFNFSPDSTQSGIQMVTFTARNQLGLTDTKSVRIVINKVNHAPVISIPPSATVEVGKQISVRAIASDPDSDILALTASGLPSNALFVPSMGTISFAPDTTQAGVHNVTVTASDGKLSASATVAITVNLPQTGGADGVSQLILQVDPVANLSLQPTQRITGSVNVPNQLVIPTIQSSLIVGLSPATGAQGSQTLAVTLTGQTSGSFPTHFENGVSQANFGAGITVNSFVVTSATSATATISIDSGASLGSRAVTVVTGNESAVSLLGFNVLKGINSITGRLLDADTKQGISGANVTIAGTLILASTGIDGSFTLFDAPAGLGNFTLNAADHELITLPVNAPVGTTVNLGDITTRSTVFNPSAAPSATLGSVFGRGGAEFSTAGRSKEDIKKVVIDAILMTGGKSAGVLDDFGNQLNPNITGNGVVSLKASGVDLVADRMISGETMTVGDFLYGFPLGFGWKTQPTLLRSLSALQKVIDEAWANPNDPLSALTITIFNRGKSTLFDAPRISPETPLNAIQAYLFSSTLFAWATNDIYYMDGSDTPSAPLLIGANETKRTLLAYYYEGNVVTDAGPPVLVADNGPIAAATADRTNVVLDPATHTKEVMVTLNGSGTTTFDGATIKLYQWRPSSSSDPTPSDGNSPTAQVKFTSGAHHTYTLTVTDTNNRQSAATVTINISGDCSFTTGADQGTYPWCSTFDNFLAGQVLTKGDIVQSKVASFLQTVQPTQNGSPEIEKACTVNLAAFATSLGLPDPKEALSFKAEYLQFSESAKQLNLMNSFVKGAGNLIQGQIDAVVGAVADKMFGYLINKFTEQIILDSRPQPPFINSVTVVQPGETTAAGTTAVSRQVQLSFKPSTDEDRDFKKAIDSSLNGIRKYSYLIFRQNLVSGEAQQVAIVTGQQLRSGVQVYVNPSNYVWNDDSAPVGTNTYFVKTRVIRTDTVPNSIDTTDQKLLMDYMLAVIPGGGTLNSAFTAIDIADTIMRGLFLQDSAMSAAAHVYVGDPSQNLHPSLDLAVDKFRGNAYLSIPEMTAIFKVLPSGLIEKFVDPGFKTPYQAGLAIDSNGVLYTDNKASDDSYGGRIFSFQPDTTARQLAGSSNYYSQMLMYAK